MVQTYKSKLKITCPPAGLEKTERIELLKDTLKSWVYSDELKDLIILFNGGDLVNHIGSNFDNDILEIDEFARIWDYRAGHERWVVQDDNFVAANKDTIIECADGLGLMNKVSTDMIPDYILPLGGARESNRVRPAMARRLIDINGWNGKNVVALSGTRPINEVERPYMQYAIGADTEYEAMNCGLEAAFELAEYTEDVSNTDNINSNSAIRKYADEYNNNHIYSLAAPSSEPEKRRANSEDTFNYFLNKFDVTSGSNILLVTSSIYVPFQTLKFMPQAIDGDFNVGCVGSDLINQSTMSKPSNYLQEVKATIDAIKQLVHN